MYKVFFNFHFCILQCVRLEYDHTLGELIKRIHESLALLLQHCSRHPRSEPHRFLQVRRDEQQDDDGVEEFLGVVDLLSRDAVGAIHDDHQSQHGCKPCEKTVGHKKE
jgi:hypothetical protein